MAVSLAGGLAIGEGGVGVGALDGIKPSPILAFVGGSSRMGGRSMGGSDGDSTTDCDRRLGGRTVLYGTRKVPINGCGRLTWTFPDVDRTRSLIGALCAPLELGG